MGKVKPEWFAGRLRELRKAATLTQAMLAALAGLNRVHLAQLEAGARHPTWETMIALCDALNVDCRAFAEPPTAILKRGKGRPRKAEPAPLPETPRAKRKRP